MERTIQHETGMIWLQMEHHQTLSKSPNLESSQHAQGQSQWQSSISLNSLSLSSKKITYNAHEVRNIAHIVRVGLWSSQSHDMEQMEVKND